MPTQFLFSKEKWEFCGACWLQKERSAEGAAPGKSSEHQEGWSGAETPGRLITCPGGPTSSSPEVRGPCLRSAVAWTPGNRPRGPRPRAPRSRRGAQKRHRETGGAGESGAAHSSGGLHGSHPQQPEPRILGHLCPELHPHSGQFLPGGGSKAVTRGV